MFHCPFELNGVCSNVYCSFQHLSLTSDAPKLLPRELLPLPPLALPNINASNHTTDADLDNKNQNGELISGMDHIGDGTVVREEAMKDDGSMSEVGENPYQTRTTPRTPAETCMETRCAAKTSVQVFEDGQSE